ncbi:MAG: hypothetical protein EBR82_01975 [Caulobacteraceae bacterium]|nr:hypothetical protein [Caulobacteraceae bacterium]
MLLAAVMSFALTGQGMGGQDPCDLDPSQACTAQRIAMATANLGLTDIKADAEGGAAVYRAFFDDGERYPAVSFERRPDHGPELVLYGKGGQTLHMPIRISLWREVVESSRYAGRELQSDGTTTSCYVQSMTTVQIARPGAKPGAYDSSQNLVVRSALDGAWSRSYSQTTCGGGLTSDYAALLYKAACEALPECEAIRDGEGDWMWNRQLLAASLGLRGDRVAAATLFLQAAEPPHSNDDPIEPSRWDRWLNLGYETRLDWDGTPVVKKGDVAAAEVSPIAAFLAERERTLGRLSFEWTTIGATDPDSGWIEGTVSYSQRQNGVWRSMQAPYRQVWRSQGSNIWKLESWTVGAFAAVER